MLERVEHATLLLLAGLLVTAALFLYWLTVARRNADLFRPRRQRLNDTELVAAHLLPGVQLYAPRVAAWDLWWASRPAAGRTASRLWFDGWWLSWAAMLGAAYVAHWGRLTRLQETTRDGGPPPGPRPADPRVVSRAELVRRVAEDWRADLEPSGDAGPEPSRPDRPRAERVPSGR